MWYVLHFIHHSSFKVVRIRRESSTFTLIKAITPAHERLLLVFFSNSPLFLASCLESFIYHKTNHRHSYCPVSTDTTSDYRNCTTIHQTFSVTDTINNYIIAICITIANMTSASMRKDIKITNFWNFVQKQSIII